MSDILTANGGLIAKLSEGSSQLNAELSSNVINLGAVISQTSGDVRLLPPLHLTPSAEAQSISASAGKAYKDIEIAGIPYYETTNESGGYTVIIGD